MARRGGDSGMNLDSLLDTLTNVVGVLVMVLMLTTLNVQQAVQRILDIDPTQLRISAADLATARQQADQARKQRETLSAQLATSGPSDTAGRVGAFEDFGALLQQVETLKTKPLAVAMPEESVAAVRNKVLESENKSKALVQQVVAAEDELARLKSLLDTTQVVAAPPAKIVSLPHPREAPAGSTQYRVIVRDGRIVPFNPAVVRDRCKKQVELMLRSPTLKTKSGQIDCEKLVEQFNKGSRVLDPNFRVQLAVVNFDLNIVFELKPTGGETPKEATTARSELRRGLKALQSQLGEKFYIRFLVWNNSFDAYVAARSVCDELGVLAGWEPYTIDYIWRESLGIAVPCEGRPPPPKPDPNAPPAPPPPAVPPPVIPNDVVD